MKILDIFYKKTICNKDEVLKYNILFGIFRLKYNNISKTFDFRALGIKILYSKLKGSFKKYYFLFLPIFFRKATKEFLTCFLDDLIERHPQYDDYYIFLSRSGEFFLLMHHFKEWLEKNNSKNFLLVFGAKYHANICKIFFSKIPAIYCDQINVPLVSRGILSNKFKYKDKNIYVPTYEQYFVDVENKIRNQNAHYYECLKEHIGLNQAPQKYLISQEVKSKINKIVKNLLEDNFILVSPETLSNEPMDMVFWKELCLKLKSKGYQIFCSTVDFRNMIDGTQSIFLTHEESIELASHAKAIIGMRSGFIECLSQNSVPKFVLYTNFPKRNGFKKLLSNKVLTGYSISKLPYIDKNLLFEYDVNTFTNNELIIEKIINNIAEFCIINN